MTSAIARWHSSARPPGDALEQAYADQLEAKMQEMAIQLHKVTNYQIDCHAENLFQKKLVYNFINQSLWDCLTFYFLWLSYGYFIALKTERWALHLKYIHLHTCIKIYVCASCIVEL